MSAFREIAPVRSALFLLLTGGLVAAACGGGGDGVAGNEVSGGAGGEGGSAAGSGDASPDSSGGSSGLNFDGGGGDAGECDDNNPCSTGVCTGGVCCPTAERACADQCCDSGDVCLFDSCVTPGQQCQTPEDCADDEYCETGLGDSGGSGGSGGAAGGGAGGAAGGGGSGQVCTQPVPLQGRCVKKPPLCANGEPPGTNGCIEKCEYIPPVDKLEGVVEWQWGLDITPSLKANFIDIWATPVVGRVVDSNCDGAVDATDSPNVVFVSGDSRGTCCSCGGFTPSTCRTGVLRVLDGRSGQELWSSDNPEPDNLGFAGLSPALGDMTGDGNMEIVAMTGAGKPIILDSAGGIIATATELVDTAGGSNFGWGGGIALGDMNNDGVPEIAYGRNLYEFDRNANTITRKWGGTSGTGNGGGGGRELVFFADLDNSGTLELLAGSTAFNYDGTTFWNRQGNGVPNGYNAVADFDGNGTPEVVVVGSNGSLYLLDGGTGNTLIDAWDIPSDGNGGPPTVADFDGDGTPEIGVAMRQFYVMVEVDMTSGSEAFSEGWKTENHDLSSSVTGSSVFDFEADGKAEVVYNDECFLWVYDGSTGAIRLAIPTTSFTATEASIVADVDGDGHAEMLFMGNGADPSASGWGCDVAPWNQPDMANNRPAWEPPAGQTAHRGLWMIGDKENSWVGTRTLWNQHAYSVTNVCDSRDSACTAPNLYGSIPATQRDNWDLTWLNNFRQNVQEGGVFDAPDATLKVDVACTTPPELTIQLRNQGQSGLPAGVEIGVYRRDGGTDTEVGRITSTRALLAGQTETFTFTVPSGMGGPQDTWVAKILIDPQNRTFNECKEDNNEAVGKLGPCGPQ